MKTRVVTMLLIGASYVAGQSIPGNDSILKSELRANLFFLASDEMKGRLTETPENQLASAFIRSKFSSLGLKPIGSENSYYHSFNIIRSTVGENNSLDIVETNTTLRGQINYDFFPLNFSARGSVKSEIVFVGFGINAPKLSHNDYKDESLRGRIVLALDHEPGELDPLSTFDGLVTSEYSRNLRKALYAQSAGAIGILFVSDIHNHQSTSNFQQLAERTWPNPPRRIPRYILESWAKRVQIPAMQISTSLAEKILKKTGSTLRKLAYASEAKGGISPILIPELRLSLTSDIRRQTVSDRNVVAAIKGSDPELSQEWIIICAHFDHNGSDKERVWNGADDNGSGTVALLEIAKAYANAASEGHRPRRSILFAAWNSEERGLLGAWAFTEEPLVPLHKVVAVLNMDMIGRNEEVPLGGGRRFRGLELQTAESNSNAVNILGYSYSADMTKAVQEANRDSELELKMRYDNNSSDLLRRSDQWPFLQKAIPSLFFHTGLHPDYHTEFDVPDRIQYSKLERIARLVHRMSWNLANSSAQPGFDKLEHAAATAR